MDSNSSLVRNSSRDTYRRPALHKDTNKLDHIVTNNLKTNKDKLNEAIKNEPTFDTDSFNLSSGTSNPLLVVTLSLREVNKNIATNVSGLTFLWDSGATNTTINKNTLKTINARCGLIK